MSSIDNRIVKMGFDNRDFTSAANATMSTLGKLSKSLQLAEGTKGLENITTKAKEVDMKPLGSAVDAVANKFSAMSVVGITALANVTNSAVNAGKRMISSLTLDPIMSGFEEYETKMNSIQTIMTNTAHAGTKMEDVTRVLDELNEYADQTIYNFAEMTRNIGTFTAAGIDLETSATAIKGIANLAAGSGSSAQQASTAMYQLSQAMAAGTVKLQDWNSVVNAGMGGKLFQDALEETARALGKGRDMSVSFRDSLESGWITTDVLIGTLQKFANDPSLTQAATQVKTVTQLFDTMKESVQSGWAQSWELIIGNKDEAAAVLTSISNAFNSIIEPSTKARNEMLKFWKENGGRDMIIEAMTNAFKALGNILKPVGEAFRNVFPAMTGQKLIDISKSVLELTKSFKISERTANNIKRTFQGLFSIIDTGVYIVKTLAGGFLDIVSSVLPASSGLLDITGSIGDFLLAINQAIKSSGVFKAIIDTITGIVKKGAETIGKAVDWIRSAFEKMGGADTSGLKETSDSILSAINPLTALGDMLKKSYDTMRNVLSEIASFFYDIGVKIADACSKIFNAISNTFGGDNTAVTNLINGGLLGVVILYLGKFIKSIKEMGKESGGFMDGIIDILDGVQGVLQGYQNNLNAEALKKIAVALVILSGALFVLASIDPSRLAGALAAMGVMFVELTTSMALFNKMMQSGAFSGMAKASFSMIMLSTAVLILTKAMTSLVDIEWEDLFKGLITTSISIKMLLSAADKITKSSKGMISSSIGLVIFSSAINVLSKAVTKLGALDAASLTKGLVGVGVLLTELSLFMKYTDISGMSIMKATGIVIFASAMNVLAIAVGKLANIKFTSMSKALGGIGILMAELSLFMKANMNSKSMISTAIGMTILGGAMLVMAEATRQFGSIDLNSLGKGLLGLSAALGLMSMGMRSIPKGIIAQAIGLNLLGSSLLIIAQAVKMFGSNDLETLGKGLLGMTAALGVLSMAMRSMTGGLGGAFAVMVMATAIGMLTPSLVILGNLKLSTIGKSLIALAGGFTVIGVAGTLLAPLSPMLLVLTGAIALFGAGIFAIGGGMLSFAAGLTALAAAGTAGVAALVAVVSAIIGLIPTAIQALAIGLVEMIKVFVTNTPLILEAVGGIITGVINILIQNTPLAVQAVMTFILAIVTELTNAIPVMVEAAMAMIGGILTGVANNIQQIVSAGIQVVLEFIRGVNSKLGDIIDTAFKTIISFINGLADAIRNNSGAMRSACWNLISSMIESITGFMGDVVNIGKDIVGGIIKGIKSMGTELINAAKGVVSGAVDKVKNFLGIHSPSRVFAEIGKYSVEGMANGLSDYSDLVSTETESIGSMAVSSMRDAMGNMVDLIDSDVGMNPTITPVLDLSEVQNGSSAIDELMSRGYNVDATTSMTSRLSRAISGGDTSKEPTGNATTNNNTANVTNNFHITGDNPKAIADEVSKILQKQLDRRNATWA